MSFLISAFLFGFQPQAESSFSPSEEVSVRGRSAWVPAQGTPVSLSGRQSLHQSLVWEAPRKSLEWPFAASPPSFPALTIQGPSPVLQGKMWASESPH